MQYGVYQVTGKRQYRGHEPGTTFEAILDPGAERRAIVRGDIKLIRHITPGLAPGSYRLPPDWLGPAAPSIEAPSGASLVSKGGKTR
jgi:hypothetical protein